MASEKKDNYAEIVAATLIEHLEKGTTKWQQPWKPVELTLPYNPVTGKRYHGGNIVWLMAQNFSDPRWMTYNCKPPQLSATRK
jgi:putative DNA primase/helicase